MLKLFPLAAYLLVFSSGVFAQQKTSSKSKLESEFRDPPVSARPRALWPWVNGNVSLSQITFELEEAKRKGMGGFDIWDIGTMVDPYKVVPAGPAFLGDESVQAIAHAMREAKRLGLELGLTISSSWNAGGSWIKPEHAAMGLFRSDTIVEGGAALNIEISFPAIRYTGDSSIMPLDRSSGKPLYFREVAIIAHPYSADSIFASANSVIVLSKGEENPARITRSLPEGKWRIVRYVCAPTGQPLAIPSTNSKGLMLDHFSAEAQKANLDYIFGRLLPVTGSLKNSALKYFYTDSYEVNSAVWTPLMAEEFRKKAGYDIYTYLPLLDQFHFQSKDTAERFLFDFQKTLSDLIIENHYELGRKLCEAQGIGFCAEAGGPGKPIHNVPFEDLKALGALTIPRGEFWNRHNQLELLQIVKGIASASHIYNQKYVEAESFTSVWLWQEGPNELKPLADRAMCEGLNRFIYHTFPHTPPESGYPGWVYNFGTLINTTNGWWPKSHGFHNYLARCSYLLQQGNFVGDVAFYYGDAAPNFVPPKKIDPRLGEGFDYDVINTEVLLEKLSVRNNKIYLPHGQSYEVLVLPESPVMNLKVAAKLKQLVQDGATIIGPKPLRTHSLFRSKAQQDSLNAISAVLWPTTTSSTNEEKIGKGKVVWGKSIRNVLAEKGVVPDLLAEELGAGVVDYIHRKTEAADIYFIRNAGTGAFTTKFKFRVVNKAPEIWNPETGEILAVQNFETSSKQTTVVLSLPVNGSVIVVFKDPVKTRKSLLPVKEEWKDTNAIRHFAAGYGIVSKGRGIANRTIPLKGEWVRSFEKISDVPARDTISQLGSLTNSDNESVKHFSGTVSYQNSFLISKEHLNDSSRLLLNLGDVREIAEVYLNGKSLGQLWHSPYEVDITDAAKEGRNYLVIEVVNTPNNRLIGEAKKSPSARTTASNIARLPNAWMKPFAEAPLLPAGLIGPVSINAITVQR